MLWYYAIVLALLGAAWGAYRVWSARVEDDITVGAAAAYQRMNEVEPEFLAGMSEEKFRAIYRRVHFPRFPGYALACAGTFLLATPAIFGLLAGLLFAADTLGLTPETADVAERYFISGDRMRVFTAAPPEVAYYYARDLGGFYYFFGLAISWLVIVYVFMRRYHARRPGYIRDEIIRSR